MKFRRVLFCFVLILFLSCDSVHSEDEDLYKVLGVARTSSNREIKAAYKRKAREWHPDKNRSPGANEKFMKINEAYETLIDAEKRQEYDQYGRTSKQAGQPQQQPGFHGFESFFSGHFGGFNFGGRSAYEKNMVTFRQYKNNIVPDSYTKPYLLLAYADMCFSCMRMEPLWEKVIDDMNTIGMGVGTVHVRREPGLANKVRVTQIPMIAMIINGKVKHLHGSFGLKDVRDFVRTMVSRDLITDVTNQNYKSFLEGWKDNRVRALFFDSNSSPTLRYALAAFAYRKYAKFGYVQLSKAETSEVTKRYSVPSYGETLLMFKEDLNRPAATVSMSYLSRNTLDEVISNNKMLYLPRLSSPFYLEKLCPVAPKQRKNLCVVLFTKDSPVHEPFVKGFRQYAEQRTEERVRFTYLYQDVQTVFAKSITRGNVEDNDTILQVAIMWRVEEKKVYFDWIENGWKADIEENLKMRRTLRKTLDWLLRSSDTLPHLVAPPPLLDEHADALITRIWQRLFDWWDNVVDKYQELDEVTMWAVFMAIILIVVVGYLMKVMAENEEELHRTRRERKAQTKYQSSGYTSFQRRPEERPTLTLGELSEETFRSLIINVKPGVRSIVILVSEETKPKLLQRFAQIMYPYSRNHDAFTFSFLQLEKHLAWYRFLLEETLEFKRQLDGININNCVGTVLALNGLRKYYCMYHAKHHKTRGKKRKVYRTANNPVVNFMGFTNSDSEISSSSESDMEAESRETDPDAEKLFEADLLLDLPVWMERLVDGQLRRFRVDQWPSMASQ